MEVGFVLGGGLVGAGKPFAGSRCQHGARVTVSSRRLRESVVMMGKKKRVVDDDDGGIEVFRSVDEGEDLLALALMEEPQEGKKKKKKKKKKDEEAEEIPAFSPVGEGEDLLQAALADDESSRAAANGASKKVPKKKRGKKKSIIVTEEENAVDVFASVEDPNALLERELETPKQQSKKQKKGKQSALVAEPDAAVVEIEQPEAVPEAVPETVSEVVSEAVPEAENGVDESGEALPEILVEEELEEEVEDLDAETIDELEHLALDVEDFTMRGVKKRAQVVRKNSLERSGGDKFVYVRMEEIAQSFKNSDVLKSVTWEVKTGDRIGLVGQNGSGKTTQLKIIAGQLEPTKGEVIKSSPRLKASFLRQEFVDELDTNAILRTEFEKSFVDESKALARYKEVETSLTDASQDMEKMESLLNEMEELRLNIEAMDAWNLTSRIDKILPLLGFDQEDLEAKVGSFSGGWKVRIGIGKLLLQNPDLLLLDEPTNHLDLDSVEWLENFLRTLDTPMVIVSHDREFMDRLCTKIVETEGGEAFEFKGNYTDFVKQKKERREQWEAAWDKQKKFVDEQTKFIRRFRASAARAAQVKSREKMLAKLEKSIDWVRQPPRGGKPLVFRFPPAPRSGRDVCMLEGITHGYNGQLLFKDANFVLERGDRIAIVGPNGAGKSTLLRLALGLEKPLQGTAECGNLHGVIPAYFAQNQADELDLNKTILQIVEEAQNGDMTYEEIRAVLGKFLFKGDAVNKKISALSGGEKARVALCKIMVSPANLLILDEPTNHLDIPAKEMLEEAIQEFDGTVLVVSHDRYFVSRIAHQILAIEDGQVELYDGDYRSYIEKNSELMSKLQSRQLDGLTTIRSAPVIQVEPAQLDRKQKKKKSFGGSGIKSGKTKEMNAKRWSR